MGQIYLQPDKAKSTKRKTKVQKKSVDPEFNEEFSFTLAAGEPYKTLDVSVWDFGGSGVNTVIGEVSIPLASILAEKRVLAWYPLVVPDERAVDLL